MEEAITHAVSRLGLPDGMACTAVVTARTVPTHERDEDEAIWLEQIHAVAESTIRPS